MSTCALRRASYATEVANVGDAIEYHDEWRLVLGYALEDILNRHILDSGNLSHDALMITARKAVELLDRHLLPTYVVARHKVLEVAHKLTLGTLLNIYALNLLASLNSLGNWAYAKNDVLHI